MLMLAWTVVGYFSVFDFGLGRGLTQAVAEKLGSGRDAEIPALAGMSLLILFLMGLAGLAIGSLLCPLLVHHLLKIPPELRQETLIALYLLTGSLPVVICTSGRSGILEAYQRFDLINYIRVPMGLFTYLGPLVMLPFTQSLVWVVAVLVTGRVLCGLIHLWFCRRLIPDLPFRPRLDFRQLAPLVRFSTWMTVSNIVGPLMTTFDRFVVGAAVSISAVAYYTTPHEVAMRMMIPPATLAQVLFPAFSTSLVRDGRRAATLFGRGVRYLFLMAFPPSLLVAIFAHDGLQLWLGAETARHATRVLQWLAIGVFINSLARVPHALIQGAGRADVTGKLHLLELPLSLLALFWGVRNFGIEGAACAWTFRATVDMLALFGIARRLVPWDAQVRRSIQTACAATLPLLLCLWLPDTLAAQGLFLGGFVLLYLGSACTWMSTADERAHLWTALTGNRFVAAKTRSLDVETVPPL
jgi:O-antigen/teichoic acid export membrane protein